MCCSRWITMSWKEGRNEWMNRYLWSFLSSSANSSSKPQRLEGTSIFLRIFNERKMNFEKFLLNLNLIINECNIVLLHFSTSSFPLPLSSSICYVNVKVNFVLVFSPRKWKTFASFCCKIFIFSLHEKYLAKKEKRIAQN